jgi:hypothetical protein
MWTGWGKVKRVEVEERKLMRMGWVTQGEAERRRVGSSEQGERCQEDG